MQTLSYFGQPPERRYSAEAGNHPHGSFVDGGQLVIGQNERFDIRARAQGLGFSVHSGWIGGAAKTFAIKYLWRAKVINVSTLRFTAFKLRTAVVVAPAQKAINPKP